MIDPILFRIRIGLHQSKKQKSHTGSHNKTGVIPFGKGFFPSQVMYAGNVCLMFLLNFIYIYILCLSMAFLVDISRSDLPNSITNRTPISPSILVYCIHIPQSM